MLKPHRKQQKKLADALNQMFGHLDSKFIATELDVSMIAIALHKVNDAAFLYQLKLRGKTQCHHDSNHLLFVSM